MRKVLTSSRVKELENSLKTRRINVNSIQSVMEDNLKDILDAPNGAKLAREDRNQVMPCIFTKEGKNVIVNHPMFGKIKIVEK